MIDCKACATTNSSSSPYCEKCGARLQGGSVSSTPAFNPSNFAPSQPSSYQPTYGQKYPALDLYIRISEVLAWLGIAATAVYLFLGWSGLSQVQAQTQGYVFLVISVIGLLFVCLAALAGAQLIRVFMDMEGHLNDMRSTQRAQLGTR